MTNGGNPQDPGGYQPPPQQGGGYQQPPGQYPQQPGGPPPQYAPVPTAPWGAPLASWGKRVGAALIDALVIVVPTIIIMIAIGIGAFAASDCVTDPTTNITTCEESSFVIALVLTNLLPMVILALYQTFMNGSERGQTVGKMALKIQVRDGNTGGPLGYGKAFLRWLVGAALNLVTCGIGTLVDLLFPLWDDKRQTIHDKAVNSLVVEVPQR